MRKKRVKEIGVNNFKFCHIPKTEDGWIDPKKYLPEKFDLVQLKIMRKDEIIYHCGWWAGSRWDGRKIRFLDKILYWKKEFNDD